MHLSVCVFPLEKYVKQKMHKFFKRKSLQEFNENLHVVQAVASGRNPNPKLEAA
jgi:hypothetical protein